MSNTFTSDGFEVTSSSETAEEIQAALSRDEKPAEEPKEAPQEAAEAPEEPEAAPEAPRPEEKRKGKHDAGARVKEATFAAAEAKRERDEIQRRYEETQNRLKELESRLGKPAEEPKKAPEPDGRPSIDDFEDYDKFVEALTDWKLEQREKAAQAKAKEEAIEQERTKSVQAFNERVSKDQTLSLRLQDPDFLDRFQKGVVQLTPSMLLGPGDKAGPLNALADRFIVSEVGPALMVHFTDHPDEVQRLSTLHPQQFWMELGHIERGLASADRLPSESKPSVSNAKPPVRPVTGSPNVGGDDFDPDEPFEAYFKKENSKARARTNTRR